MVGEASRLSLATKTRLRHVLWLATPVLAHVHLLFYFPTFSVSPLFREDKSVDISRYS
jgi:hypothetical protein